MTKSQVLKQALELPAGEQLELAQMLFDQNAGPDDFELTPELTALLRRRAEEVRAHPENSVPWEAVERELSREA